MQFESEAIYAIPSAAPTITPAVKYSIPIEFTLDVNISPPPSITPDKVTSIFIPILSWSFRFSISLQDNNY